MSYRSSSYGVGLFGCLTIVVILVIALVFCIWKANTTHYEVVTIQSKERQCDGGKDGSCYYVVFGTNDQIYENRDTMLKGKWDSGSLQAKLHVGQTYKLELVGWRIPFFSMRENIVNAAVQ